MIVSRRVVIAHVDRPLALRSSTPGASVRWLYLAPEHAFAARWATALGQHQQRLEATAELDAIAQASREGFVEWVDGLATERGQDVAWWITELSERNTQVDPLFLYLCYLELARRCLRVDPPDLVICASWGLVEAVEAIARQLGIEPEVRGGPRRAFRNVIAAGRIAASLALFTAQAIRDTIAVRTPAAATRLLTDTPAATLLQTCVHEGDVNEKGRFLDRYLPGLQEWLEASGHRVLVIPIPPSFAPVRTRGRNFVLPIDWLGLSDYLAAVRTVFRGWQLLRHLPPPEPEAGPLLADAAWHHPAARRPRQAALLARLPARLHKAGLEPRSLLAWSENQVHEKCLVRAFRDAFTGLSITGIQNTPLYPNQLSLFPTAGECAAGTAPDRMVCSGPMPASILAKSSHERLPTEVAAGLRYEYLNGVSLERRSADSSFTVIVALPGPTGEAADLLTSLESVIALRPQFDWKVKLHPNFASTDLPGLLVALGRKSLDTLQPIDWPLREWPARTDVLITAGSGTALEALALGLPVVLVGAVSRLTYDPFAWFTGLDAGPYFTPEAIIRRLDALSNANQAHQANDRAQSAARVRDAWFSPVTPEALARLAGD